MNKPIIKTYEKEQNMINAKTTDIPVPVTRTEHFMYSAITGNESGLKADTQAEMYLDAIKNSDTSDLEGIESRTVLDMYLEARQTGVVDDLPKPRTTSEMLLYQAITGEDLGAKPVSNMDKYLSLLEPNNYDARLEIESEESVIHLIDSKNGRVEIKELEGNTLVNYVQDGAKELTLNGDIEAEGTNVTLTDTVDNGLVDVACEGNTLVNLMGKHTSLEYATYNSNDNSIVINQTSTKKSRITFDNALIEPNKTYTVQFNIVKNTLVNSDTSSNRCAKLNLVSYNKGTYMIDIGTVGVIKVVLTQPSETTHNGKPYFETFSTTTGELIVKDFIALEGDWTNKEIPPYFEGMKSVGECEDNKLEILSRNKNLFDIDRLHYTTSNITNFVKDKARGRVEITYKDNCGYPYAFYTLTDEEVNFIKGKQILIKRNLIQYDSNVNHTIQLHVTDEGGNASWLTDGKTVPANAKTINLQVHGHNSSASGVVGNTTIYENIFIGIEEMGDVYIPHSTNKKEITLSEPLRALPNGVKDKLVKVGSKYYVERNINSIKLDGSVSWRISTITYDGKRRFIYDARDNIQANVKDNNNPISDKYIVEVVGSVGITSDKSPLCYHAEGRQFYLDVDEMTLDEFNTNYIKNNPFTIVYRLLTPTYEELPIEPTLNTYNDITHISNNSTIPCNMKVTNTGYNAIIKPSTQYTVAFDTDVSGEVGINLAGSKVTTTNNVATVTTPSTLVDDSLRLTGKGIKASNIRLLEGDKTNWIPSYFEGMKSSFEDKLQDDGTYKIEITSANTDNTLSNKIQFSSIEPLRSVGDVKDKIVVKNGKLMIERNCASKTLTGKPIESWFLQSEYDQILRFATRCLDGKKAKADILTDHFRKYTNNEQEGWSTNSQYNDLVYLYIRKEKLETKDVANFENWLSENPTTIVYQLAEPTYEEITPELQKLILKCYDNATLHFNTNIPPKSLISYTANTSNIYKYLDTLKLSEEQCDSIINSMERV